MRLLALVVVCYFQSKGPSRQDISRVKCLSVSLLHRCSRDFGWNRKTVSDRERLRSDSSWLPLPSGSALTCVVFIPVEFTPPFPTTFQEPFPDPARQYVSVYATVPTLVQLEGSPHTFSCSILQVPHGYLTAKLVVLGSFMPGSQRPCPLNTRQCFYNT